jgi:hypothetical protein
MIEKRAIISITDKKWVTPNPSQALLHQDVLPWLSARRPNGNSVFQHTVIKVGRFSEIYLGV